MEITVPVAGPADGGYQGVLLPTNRITSEVSLNRFTLVPWYMGWSLGKLA